MKAIFLILALASTTAHAQFITGNELLERLTGSNIQQVHGVGYITGIADAEVGSIWCPPPAITVRQVVDVTRRTLDAVPEKRHESAAAFVIASIRRAWPCESKTKGRGDML